MIRNLVFIFIFLIANSVFCQEVIIVDENNNPVSNAAVFNKDKSITALSDLNGVVNLSRFSSNELISFQHPRYAPQEILKKLLLKNSVWRVSEVLHEISEVVLSYNQNTNNIKNNSDKKIFITKKEIEKMNTENLADLLEKKGGVSVQKSQFGGGSPNIRGFEANKILLVVDGVRLNNAIYRSGHLQNIITIDESVLESAEVIFGPSSVLYGSDALGGTINMSTKRLYFSNKPKTKTSFFSRYASAYNGISSHQSFLYESKKFSIFNAFSIKDYGDVKMGEKRSHGYDEWGLVHHYINNDGELVENSDPNIQKNTGFQQLDIINKMLFKINNEWRLSSNIQYSTSSNVPRFDKLNDVNDEVCEACDSNLPKYLYWYYGPQNRFLGSLSLLGLEERRLFDKSVFILAYQKVEESRNQQKYNTLDDSITIRRELVDVFSINTNFKKGGVSYGAELIYNLVSSTTNAQELTVGSTRYPEGGSNTFSSALYLNYLKNLNNNLLFEAGLRQTFSALNADFGEMEDRNVLGLESSIISENWNIFSGNAKMTYYPSSSWKISAVLSKGFHAPNIDDMGKVFVKGNNITVPNVNLQPETAYSQEISISKEGKLGVFYANGFFTQIKNAILKDSILVNKNAGNPALEPNWDNTTNYDGESVFTFANQNKNRVDIFGFTIGVNSSLTKNIILISDVNFTKGINKDLDLPVAHIPPVFGKISLQKKGERLSCFLDFQYSLEKDIEDFDLAGVDNREEVPFEIVNPDSEDQTVNYLGLPRWSTLNFSLSYNFSEKINCQLSINNILDEHYKSFGSGVSAPGRNFISTIRINY